MKRQEKVKKWASKVLSMPFVVLDTETTGLVPGKIVDIAIIDGQTGAVLLDTLVNPGQPIPIDASFVHGIFDEMVKDAPTFPDILPEVKKLLTEKLCVIYNADFDTAFLEAEGLDIHQYYFACLMKRYARYYGEWSDYFGSWKFQSLSSACRTCGIELNGAHRAINDAKATRELIRFLGS